MPKWIDLKERQPKHGQLVAVRGPYTVPIVNPPDSLSVHITACTWGTSSDWRHPPEEGATHWYPLPEIFEKPDPEREWLRVYFKEAYQQCLNLERKLRERAPLIEWTVMPSATYGVQVVFHHAWLVTGKGDVNGQTLTALRTITDEMLYHGAIDVIGYMVHEFTYDLARQMLRQESGDGR